LAKEWVKLGGETVKINNKMNIFITYDAENHKRDDSFEQLPLAVTETFRIINIYPADRFLLIRGYLKMLGFENAESIARKTILFFQILTNSLKIKGFLTNAEPNSEDFLNTNEMIAFCPSLENILSIIKKLELTEKSKRNEDSVIREIYFFFELLVEKSRTEPIKTLLEIIFNSNIETKS
jgi:hypothetical protein